MAYSAVTSAEKDAESGVTVSLVNKLDTNPFQTDSPLKGGAGAALKLLQTANASSNSSIEFIDIFDSVYDEYIFLFNRIIPASSGRTLESRLSNDSGSTYVSSGYHNALQELRSDALLTSVGEVNFIQQRLTVSSSEAGANYSGISGEYRVYNPLTRHFFTLYDFVYKEGSGPYTCSVRGAGHQSSSSSPWDSIKFFFSSGNILSGTIRAFGIQKT